MRLHGGTAQQVLQVQFPKVLHADAPAGQIGQARQGADMHRDLPQAGNDVVTPFPADTGQGQQNIGHTEAQDQRRHLGRREHVDTVDAAANLGRVVIQKSNCLEVARHRETGHRLDASGARAINQQPAGRRCRAA